MRASDNDETRRAERLEVERVLGVDDAPAVLQKPVHLAVAVGDLEQLVLGHVEEDRAGQVGPRRRADGRRRESADARDGRHVGSL